MKIVFLFIHLIIAYACYGEEITPYKFTDSLPYIHSIDAFVEKAKNLGVNVTYLRVEDMDQYVRKRPDIINQTFEWLKSQL